MVYDSAGGLAGGIVLDKSPDITTIDIVGGGFADGERVSVAVLPRQFPIVLAEGVANESGAFVVTGVELPDVFEASLSPFTVEATGDQGNTANSVFRLVTPGSAEGVPGEAENVPFPGN